MIYVHKYKSQTDHSTSTLVFAHVAWRETVGSKAGKRVSKFWCHQAGKWSKPIEIFVYIIPLWAHQQEAFVHNEPFLNSLEILFIIH